MGTTGIPPISTPVLWKAVFPLQVLRCPTSTAPRSGYLYVAVLAGPVTNLQTRQDNSELGTCPMSISFLQGLNPATF